MPGKRSALVLQGRVYINALDRQVVNGVLCTAQPQSTEFRMLDQLRSYVVAAPYEIPPLGSMPDQAAVLLALTDNSQDPSIVLTKRSAALRSHRGEVSLPGGKPDDEDADLLQTALREAEEEIGLDPDLVDVWGPLPISQTYRQVNVTPIVGVVPEGLEFRPNPGELDAVFEVPVRFLVEDRRIRTDIFAREFGYAWSPAYDFQGFQIWGFTSRVLINFLNEALDLGISEHHSAPVMNWPKSK